jgi:hypothetical protein
MTAAPRAPGGVLGLTGLTTSRLGFGCYRVDDETPAHKAALLRAIESGCTVIDTSTNYADGHSENLVGEVLDDLGRRDQARREIVLVSKIGYVWTEPRTGARAREERRPFPEMVVHGRLLALHPSEFLRDQADPFAPAAARRAPTSACCTTPVFLSDAAHRADAPIERAPRSITPARRLRVPEEAAKAGEIRLRRIVEHLRVARRRPGGDPVSPCWPPPGRRPASRFPCCSCR